MLADHVLQILERLEVALQLLVLAAGCHQFRAVPRALGRDSQVVQLIVRRHGRELCRRQAKLPKFGSGDVASLLARLHLRQCGNRDRERVQQLEVPWRPECGEQLVARALPRVLEPRDEQLAGFAITVERLHLGAKPLDQHVTVANRAEQPREPLQLTGERRQTVAEQRLGRTDQRPAAPRGDPELVDVLGVVAQPNTGVVAEELAQLLGQQHVQQLDRRCSLLRLRARRSRQNAQELRRAFGFLRSRFPQRPAQALEVVVFAVDELDLDLGKRAGRSAGVEHGDRVERHVGDRPAVVGDPHPGAARPQRRDRAEPPVTHVRGEEGRERRRRADGPAGRLDLRACVPAARQLELPARQPVLDPPAERDARACERAVGSVVVGGGEQARFERLAREVGERESLGQLELQLPFDEGAHPARS